MQSSELSQSQSPEAKLCLICLDENTPPTPFEFPCGCKGDFHAACIETWHSQKEKEDVCPICRVGPQLTPKPAATDNDGLNGARFCVSAIFFGYIGWMVGLLILHAVS